MLAAVFSDALPGVVSCGVIVYADQARQDVRCLMVRIMVMVMIMVMVVVGMVMMMNDDYNDDYENDDTVH